MVNEQGMNELAKIFEEEVYPRVRGNDENRFQNIKALLEKRQIEREKAKVASFTQHFENEVQKSYDLEGKKSHNDFNLNGLIKTDVIFINQEDTLYHNGFNNKNQSSLGFVDIGKTIMHIGNQKENEYFSNFLYA